MVVNPDRDLDLETIKRYNFKPPSALNLTYTDAIEKVIEGINRVNTHANKGWPNEEHTQRPKRRRSKKNKTPFENTGHASEP